MVTLLLFVAADRGTVGLLPFLGREFMPELEEGNLYIRGTFPINASLEEVADKTPTARAIIGSIPRSPRSRRRSAGPTTAPIRPASTMPSFPSRCSRTNDWPAVVSAAGWLRWLAAPCRAPSRN